MRPHFHMYRNQKAAKKNNLRPLRVFSLRSLREPDFQRHAPNLSSKKLSQTPDRPTY